MIPTLSLEKERRELVLALPYEWNGMTKSLSNKRWSKEKQAWVLPATIENYQNVTSIVPRLRVASSVKRFMNNKAIEEAELQIIKERAFDPDIIPLEPVPLKTKPFAHQVAGYNMGITTDNLGLFFEQGCGKSLTAIAIAGRRFLRGEVNRLLIVAPPSVMPVWPGEFEDHADFGYRCRVLDGPVKKRVEELAKNTHDHSLITAPLDVVVINYEATWRMEDSLKAYNPDMIICDESQKIKTPGSKQSKCVGRLGKGAKYRICLTGTPISQNLLDIWAQYRFLDPNVYPGSFYAFRNRYALMGGYENREIIRYKNLPEFVSKMHSVALRVKKEDALDLPEQLDQVMFCKLESSAQSIYRALVKESVAELQNEKQIVAVNVLSRLLRLSQITGGFVNDGTGITKVSEAKLTLLSEILDDLLINEEQKIVIFARFLPEIEAIRKMLDEKEIGHEWIAGAVKISNRGEAVERFQEDPGCRVFVAQIQTAGQGITLHAANVSIFYSMDYSFTNYDQAKARIHRIGQTKPCTHIHLLAQGTVDEHVWKALRAKKSVADQVVDNWQSFF